MYIQVHKQTSSLHGNIIDGKTENEVARKRVNLNKSMKLSWFKVPDVKFEQINDDSFSDTW